MVDPIRIWCSRVWHLYCIIYQWLNVAVGRHYPFQIDDPKKVIGFAALGFWTATAALFFIVVLPFSEVFKVDPFTVGILFLITVLLGLHTLALQVANAKNEPIRYGILSWAKGGGALLAGFILIEHGIGGMGALMGLLAALLFTVIAFAPKPLLQVKFGTVDKRLAEEMFRYGLPLTFSHLAIAVVDVADRFMIGSMLGVAHIAPYAVAYDLVK
jgi:O-antigen/teichoic acid export membrane protein